MSTSQSKGLIVFFIPPQKIVNGGVMSIFSICKVSRQLKAIHGSEIVIATYPGYPSYGTNDLFENDETIYSFDTLVKQYTPESLQLHIPEYASAEIFAGLKKYSDYLKAIPDLSVNILNQNILLMPQPAEVASWFALTPNVTQTTAHKKYTTQQLANQYNLPTLHLSVFIDPDKYERVPYSKKENLIVLSPDVTDKKDAIIQKLTEGLPTYEVKIIENMRYEEYKRVVGSAKFNITFGEGFDGYYIEAFLSGSMALAVYNEDFFPDKSYAGLPNVYPDYEAMLENIVADIKQLDAKPVFDKVVQANAEKILTLYSFEAYRENIRKFYRGEFTYLPDKLSSTRLIGEVVKAKEAIISAYDKRLEDVEALNTEKEAVIQRLSAVIADRDKAIKGMADSYSWKLTKPLRQARAPLKRKR